MTGAMSAVEAAIKEAARLESVLKKGRPRIQVTLSDEKSLAKSTALTWFTSHKEPIAAAISESKTSPIDDIYKKVLELSERAGARSTYLSLIKDSKKKLVSLRSECASVPKVVAKTGDKPPDFAPLISDPAMQQILVARWVECTKCLGADVPLAATVMMGGLLEALLLARINSEPTKQPIFTAKKTPKDRAGKSKPLAEWMLKDFIEIAHEMTWITVSAKDVGAVLRDYRNYIHPQKQLSHGVHLKPDDASLFWEVSKSITRQVIESA